MTTFGERLRTLRREAGLSQQDLAGETLSPSYVSLLESDKRQPSPDVVQVLAARLGCSRAQLDASDSAEQARTRASMEVEYARMALARDAAAAAADVARRLHAVLAEEVLAQTTRDEAAFLLAQALELADDVPGAVRQLEPLFERSLEHATHLQVTTVGHALCARFLQSGALNSAVAVGGRALAHAEETGLAGTDDQLTLAATLIWAHFERGDLMHAAALATRYAAVAQEHGNRSGQGKLHWNAALVAEADGRLDEALALARRATAFLSEGGTTRHLVRVRIQLAWYLVRTDPARAREAARLLDDLTDDLAEMCGPADLALWDCYRAHVHLVLDEPQDAERLARRALLTLTGQTMSETPFALRVLGDAALALGRDTEAVEQWQAAVEVLSLRPSSRQVAAALREAGERLLAAGRVEQGLAALRRALDAVGIPVAVAADPVGGPVSGAVGGAVRSAAGSPVG